MRDQLCVIVDADQLSAHIESTIDRVIRRHVESFSIPGKVAEEPKLLLTPSEAAKALSISERHLANLAARGDIARVKIGSSVRYATEDLQSFIQKNKSRFDSSKAGTRAATSSRDDRCIESAPNSRENHG